MREIVVGDIHGCYHTLLKLLLQVEYQEGIDRIIFLGDYIDRGLKSYEVVSFLIELEKNVGKDMCICLMGNHENMCFSGHDAWNWNGSRQTIDSYQRNNCNGVSKEHLEWMGGLRYIYESDGIICSHAGVPDTNIEYNTDVDLIWSRDWIQRPIGVHKKLVVCGHTPDKEVRKIKNNSMIIDTGCVFRGKLTALIYEDGEVNIEYVIPDFRDIPL